MVRRGICLLLCAVLLCTLLAGCQEAPAKIPGPGEETLSLEQGYGIRAAVVYSGGEAWKDTLYYLEQAPMLGLQVQGLAAEEADLTPFDVLYLDESLLESAPTGFVEVIEEYTRAGGAVFLPNGFCQMFPREYLGISEIKAVEGCCVDPAYPECSGDESALQQIVRDFSDLYPQYADFSALSSRSYGFGVVTDTALPLVKWGDLTVYALNSYGDGTVFLTNPLLPSAYSTGSLTMEREAGDSAFASTTSSFNQLLLCGFAEYVAQQRYGYALERAYGYFGTPSMAWELHYEEQTGIANESMQIFSRLCEQYNQIPSFTLIRNSYTWFLRAESVTYLLNQGNEGFTYQMDLYENAYSSGTHVDADGKWLSVSELEDAGSYFVDYPEYTLRAYPTALDYTGDGVTDIFCGSEDGRIYYYEGIGFTEGRWKVKAAKALTDPAGEPIRCGSFSAPQLADVDGDGLLDLLCGWNDGCIRWFAGNGTSVFEEKGMLLSTDIPGQALPAVGDWNGDGVMDLAVGSDKGILMLYYGGKDETGCAVFDHYDVCSLSKVCANGELGVWLAPVAIDWNRDGLTDLAVGVFDGYVAILLAQDDGFVFDGFITADEMNFKGNHNLKFGNWSVPCFADLNGDGQLDLVCGSQEYGMAYPIDGGYFPHERELREQAAYAKEHDYYVGIHFYTNSYASAEREAYELAAHKAAFDYYGFPTEKVGANQHTWYTSTLSGAQSMSSIDRAGLYWQSGFAAPGAAATTPQAAAENVVALPFFLMEEGERTMLVQNNATLLYAGPDWYARSARYHMPVCIYYHCDFAYESDEPTHAALQSVQRFREDYGYNFNREDQLMLASAAALHQSVGVQGGLAEGDAVTLSLAAPTGAFDLYDENVYRSLGVRMVFSKRVNAEDLQIDADVWYREGNAVVLGLNRSVTVSRNGEEEGGAHIRRINMAANIGMTDTGAKVDFLSGGMMELAVEGNATTDTPGWTVIEREHETVFTKYGTNGSLNLIF